MSDIRQVILGLTILAQYDATVHVHGYADLIEVGPTNISIRPNHVSKLERLGWKRREGEYDDYFYWYWE